MTSCIFIRSWWHEIRNQKQEESEKLQSAQVLNNTLLNEINQYEMINFLQLNKSKNTAYQNFGDTTEEILRGKFVAVSAPIKNQIPCQ